MLANMTSPARFQPPRGTRPSSRTADFRGDFRHDLLWCGISRSRHGGARGQNRRIEKITIQGVTYFPEENES